MTTKVFLLGLALSLAACDRGSATDFRDGPTNTSVRPLRGLPSDAVVVGLAIQPDSEFYVLDQRSGVYRVDDQGATLIFNTSGLSGIELTDVVATDSRRFALTAENDGFLYDGQTQELTSYFCYLPSPPSEPQGEPTEPGQATGGSSPGPAPLVSLSQRLQAAGIAVKQRTESVAFNENTGQLFAQPQTIRLDDGSVAGSELFVFDPGGGEPVQVLELEQSFVAGGMAALPGDRLLLGSGSTIFEVTISGTFRTARELQPGIVITGMARAPNGSLWVLDGAGKRLIDLGDAF